MAIRITSNVVANEVYVRCGDIIKLLYADLSDDCTEEQKRYIRVQIKNWEIYEEDILKQVKK